MRYGWLLYWTVQLKHDELSSRSPGLGAAPRTGGFPIVVASRTCAVQELVSLLPLWSEPPPSGPLVFIHRLSLFLHGSRSILPSGSQPCGSQGCPPCPLLCHPEHKMRSHPISSFSVPFPLWKPQACYRLSSFRFLLVIQLGKSFSCLFGKNLWPVTEPFRVCCEDFYPLEPYLVFFLFRYRV